MCGICGIVALKDQRPHEGVLAHMVESLHHRGPDDSGYVIDGPCGLGNTRLAIIDLSDAGHQPMHVSHPHESGSGRLPEEAWIAYNGEAYNFLEVRAALEAVGHRFCSQTDTETILRAYLQFGPDHFIKAFRGMFALAIWDVNKQRLILMRDRLGQKPLYYFQTDDWLIFGSEIKSLLVHPAVPACLNESLIPHYLTYGYAPAPDTLFEGIKMLPPGHMLTLELSEGATHQTEIRPYWEPPAPAHGPDPRDETDIIADLRMHLRWAVKMRMISDVPLGAFLSGGLDSAAVVAMMAQESPLAIKTFAIGFSNEPTFDETGYARRVAAHFATDHQEFIVEPSVIDLVDELVWSHDQPFGDSSAIPTYLVSKMARDYVTVALTGDGGDELFAGYNRFRAARMAQTYDRLPRLARQAIGSAARQLPQSTGYRGIVRRASRFVSTAGMSTSERYLSWIRYVPGEWVSALVGDAGEQRVQTHYANLLAQYQNGSGSSVVNNLLSLNLHTYLPEDLLVKSDRCSMAVSLEARSPFLDHHLVQFAADIPTHLKLKQGRSKYILKEAMRGLIPDDIIDRKKHGFGVPIGAWFRGSLADYARSVLIGERATRRSLFDATAVQSMLDAHQSGRRELGNALWTLLTFELWMQRYFD